MNDKSLASRQSPGCAGTSSQQGEDVRPIIKEEPRDFWENLDGGQTMEIASLMDCTKEEVIDQVNFDDRKPVLNMEGTARHKKSGDDYLYCRDKCETASLMDCSQEEAIDLENYDDDGQPLLNLGGVIEYMMSHDDYLYCGDEPETDYQSAATVEDNPALNKELSEKLKKLKDNPQFARMLSFRKKLPSFAMKDTLIAAVNKNQVLVISGETGCGKTTQVPQFILDDYIARGIGSQCAIICTQPRRISAISVAERVAAERCESVDKTGMSGVGYQIRLEAKRPRPQGSVLFCTTGIVLKFLENDPCLKRATHIILDEIHERDLLSDFLMIILKDLLLQRPDLRLILMSATLNAELFSSYFGNCPALNIPGFTFPVKEYYLEDIIEMTRYSPDPKQAHIKPKRHLKGEQSTDNPDYRTWCKTLTSRYRSQTISVLQEFDYNQINLDLAQHIVNYICTHMGEGGVLVFVPGWEEIKKLHEMIQASAKSGSLRVIPLHSLMPTVNQREVFDRPPPGIRKIVIATNIAETSITIDDIVFVVDCGKIKMKTFQPELNLTCLQPLWVSKANAKQRRGRAGRVQSGHCFHLFTKFHDNLLPDSHLPEMLRTRLEELCLQIKLLHLGQIVPFLSKAMEHPSIEAVQHAIDTLTQLKALDANENLLPLGYHLARLPVEPHAGKMILFGAMFCCLDPILTVAASLSFKDAFIVPLGLEERADRAKLRLADGNKSDHIMLINAFKGWEESVKRGNSHTYCWDNFLSVNTLKMLRDMKKQFTEHLYELGFVATKDPKDPQANINSGNLGLIRAVMCAGLYPNVAQVIQIRRGGKHKHLITMVTKDNSRVYTHPKSVNSHQSFFESKWVVFYYKLKTSRVFLHDSTMVSPYALLFFGGDIKIAEESNTELVTVDDWITFKSSAATTQLVKDLRQQLDKLLTLKITRPGPTKWDRNDKEGALMRAIVDLITIEDKDYSDETSAIKGSIGRKH